MSFHGPLGCPQAGKMIFKVGKYRHQVSDTQNNKNRVPSNSHKWKNHTCTSQPVPHRVLPCALQCPKIVPGPSQYRPRVLQDAKVEAPSMPNDTHGHHKPENRLQKWQESGIQDPASQHTFQQRSLIKQIPTNDNLPNQ